MLPTDLVAKEADGVLKGLSGAITHPMFTVRIQPGHRAKGVKSKFTPNEAFPDGILISIPTWVVVAVGIPTAIYLLGGMGKVAQGLGLNQQEKSAFNRFLEAFGPNAASFMESSYLTSFPESVASGVASMFGFEDSNKPTLTDEQRANIQGLLASYQERYGQSMGFDEHTTDEEYAAFFAELIIHNYRVKDVGYHMAKLLDPHRVRALEIASEIRRSEQA